METHALQAKIRCCTDKAFFARRIETLEQSVNKSGTSRTPLFTSARGRGWYAEFYVYAYLALNMLIKARQATIN